MTQTAVKITGLTSKITAPLLKTNFEIVGPVLNIKLFDDLKSNKCAEIMFESEAAALKAVEDFNGKQIVKSNITVELIKVFLFNFKNR